jgi:hypothetical protein
MLFLIWLVLCLVAFSLIALPLALWRHEIYKRYSGSRLVACPEDHRPAVVNMDASHAVATGVHGRPPDLHLSDCTRWPERAGCDRGCIAQAVQAGTPATGEVRTGSKPIHHLPVLLAAFAAWTLGAIWHSQYFFRPRVMGAIGLTRAQVKQMVWWISPHLLTAAACLLFAYGVAWLLTVCHRKGVLQGILMSVLLCGALIAASGYGLARLPHDLLAIEAGYAVLATLVVGAVVGGLYDKLVLPAQ